MYTRSRFGSLSVQFCFTSLSYLGFLLQFSRISSGTRASGFSVPFFRLKPPILLLYWTFPLQHGFSTILLSLPFYHFSPLKDNSCKRDANSKIFFVGSSKTKFEQKRRELGKLPFLINQDLSWDIASGISRKPIKLNLVILSYIQNSASWVWFDIV